MMSRHHFSCRDISSKHYTLPPLVGMSRHQSSCRDISLCCCRLHWLFVMSRLQLPCRDINLFNFCSLLGCMCCDSCPVLHEFSFDLFGVATSELDCVGLKTASTAQPVIFIYALLLTAFLSTYCCIFLLSFSFPVNDTWVSFFIFLHNNYSFLNEKQTKKWTKKR